MNRGFRSKSVLMIDFQRPKDTDLLNSSFGKTTQIFRKARNLSNDIEMAANATFAGYRPEKMIIRLSPNIRIVDDEGNPEAFPTANAFAVFMHEYFHYIHNISTAAGLAGFINLLEQWRLFRETIDKTGFSAGSEQLDKCFQKHRKTLVRLAQNVRAVHKPDLRKIIKATSIEVLSTRLCDAVENETETLLASIKCKAKVVDDGGTAECHTIEIGVQEIMEAAAWLLECRYVDKSASGEQPSPAAFFPYKVVPALVNHQLEGADDESILACVLAALHSTNPPEALMGIMEFAKTAGNQRASVFEAVQKEVRKAVASNETVLLQQIDEIENEFSGQNIMAVGIRSITSQVKSVLQLRKCEPFFEIAFVDLLAANEVTIDDIMNKIPACNVLQENFGSDDNLQRDLLVSFRPKDANGTDPEVGLRVIHAIFDFVGRHIRSEGFIATGDLPNQRCPFYTSCGLELRKRDLSICKNTPWQSADWSGWKQENKCDYGAAIAITRPPIS
jgi:hypothetical protein